MRRNAMRENGRVVCDRPMPTRDFVLLTALARPFGTRGFCGHRDPGLRPWAGIGCPFGTDGAMAWRAFGTDGAMAWRAFGTEAMAWRAFGTDGAWHGGPSGRRRWHGGPSGQTARWHGGPSGQTARWHGGRSGQTARWLRRHCPRYTRFHHFNSAIVSDCVLRISRTSYLMLPRSAWCRIVRLCPHNPAGVLSPVMGSLLRVPTPFVASFTYRIGSTRYITQLV